MKGMRSGIRHLEEITEAGLEPPAVNQIQVRSLGTLPGYPLSTHFETLHWVSFTRSVNNEKS